MSRAKMYQINPDKLRRLLAIVGTPKEISINMGWGETYLREALKDKRISRPAARDLEKLTKIQLIDYIADGETPTEYTEQEEHQITLIMEALRRYEKKKERTKR